jgi:uncharacterized membrane protein
MGIATGRAGTLRPVANTNQPHTRPSLTTRRLEALSDGVIAIAATLLVLEIKNVPLGTKSLTDSLLERWPSYLGYLISFVVIGLIWVAHHGMFERVHAVDRQLLFLNLALLLLVGFIPFPTEILATFIREGGTDASVATAFYSLVMTLIGVVFTLQWWHLVHHPHLMIDSVTEKQLRRSLRMSSVSPIVYGITIPLAFLSPWICVIVYIGLSGYFARGPSARALIAMQKAADEAAGITPPAELGTDDD